MVQRGMCGPVMTSFWTSMPAAKVEKTSKGKKSLGVDSLLTHQQCAHVPNWSTNTPSYMQKAICRMYLYCRTSFAWTLPRNGSRLPQPWEETASPCRSFACLCLVLSSFEMALRYPWHTMVPWPFTTRCRNSPRVRVQMDNPYLSAGLVFGLRKPVLRTSDQWPHHRKPRLGYRIPTQM
jgi:hypothetical protein